MTLGVTSWLSGIGGSAEPPRSIPRRVRAWAVSVHLEGRWEVRKIRVSAPWARESPALTALVVTTNAQQRSVAGASPRGAVVTNRHPGVCHVEAPSACHKYPQARCCTVAIVVDVCLNQIAPSAPSRYRSEMAGRPFSRIQKTSTATQPGGATVEEIPLMRATGGPQVVGTSSAYVTDIGKTLALYAAGARRFGTGDTQAILAGRKNKLALAGARAELATASIHNALSSGRSGEGVRVPGSRTQFTSPWRHSPPRSPSSPGGRGRLGRSPAGDSDSPDSTRAPRRPPSAPPSACSPWAYPHWPCW